MKSLIIYITLVIVLLSIPADVYARGTMKSKAKYVPDKHGKDFSSFLYSFTDSLQDIIGAKEGNVILSENKSEKCNKDELKRRIYKLNYDILQSGIEHLKLQTPPNVLYCKERHDICMEFEKFELKRNKMQFLSSITVGGIAGLECANPNSNYDNCLVVTREFTVLLKINMKFICEKCKDFRSFLKPLYEEQVKINNLAEKKLEKRKSEKINNDLALKNNEYQQKYLEKEITLIRHRIQSAKETRIFNSKNRLKEKKLDNNITKFTKNHQHLSTFCL